MRMTREQMKKYLLEINIHENVVFSLFSVFQMYFRKEKSIFQNLNKLAPDGSLFVGFMWSHLPKHRIVAEMHRVNKLRGESSEAGIGHGLAGL